MAAALTCPYCSHAIVTDAEELGAERCPSCDGELLIAYRYRLVRAVGEVSGGVLYEAVDSGFAQPMAVLFVADPSDRAASERFVAGHRLFANLRTRGLVGIHEVSRSNHRRPHVVMDWLAGGTLDRHVGKHGPLDPTIVWATTSDLLIGFERAHRALPALVHGQVHPGKIGFRRPPDEGGAALLYGFEWARQVSEQDSSLADSFRPDAEAVVERASSLDLRALARTIVYAATGRWIEDGPTDRQRQQAAAMMPGPMAPFIDQLLAAGTPDGYRSTSVARDEFELIRAGGERHRPRAPDRKVAHRGMGEHAELIDVGEDDVVEDEGDEYEEEEDEPAHSHSHAHAPQRPTPGPSPDLFEQVRQRQAKLAMAQAHATAQAAAAKQQQQQPGKGKFIAIGMFALFGVCTVSSIVKDLENQDQAPPPPVHVQTVPPSFDWTPPEVASEVAPEALPPPIVQPPTFAARVWSAKVESTIKGGPIKDGSKCELWVTPYLDSSYNCKWAVDCKEKSGWTRYYGNTSSGLGYCEIEGDKVVAVSDLEDDDGDGLMVFDGAAEQPWALFGDRFADPARVVLMHFHGEGKLAEQPSQAEPRPLARLDRSLVDEQKFADAGRLLDELGASVGLSLDFVPGDPDAAPSDGALPETLDIFALQSVIDGIKADLEACSAPAGTKVDVDLTVVGSTGTASAIDLANTVDGDHDLCLRLVLMGAQFDRFTDETLSVSWTISW